MNQEKALHILKECASSGMGYGNEAFNFIKNELNKMNETSTMEKLIRKLHSYLMEDIGKTIQDSGFKPIIDIETQLKTLQLYIQTERMYQEYLLSRTNTPQRSQEK